MSKIICVAVGLLSVMIVMAQPTKQYSFTHYSTASGLLSNQVNSVVQDDEGYIWMGTTDGLQRYDGVRYKSFRHNEQDPRSIPANPIGQLLLDKNKNLWLLLANGKAGIFNTKTFTFKEATIVTRNPAASNASIRELHSDEYGNVFLVLTNLEVLTWNQKNNSFSYANNFFKLKEEWRIIDFIQQPGTQKYWIGILGGSIAIYNKATGQLSYPGNNVENEPAIDSLSGLINPFHFYFDKQGRVWFINWQPVIPFIHCYDLKTNRFVIKNVEFNGYFRSYHEIHGFFEQQDGSIWVRGTPIFAKYLESDKKFQMVHNGYLNEQSIAYSVITGLCEDKEKNIWVATDNNGLYRFNPSTEFFTNVKHINRSNLKTGDGSPMSFIATKWGTVLAGAWGDGMYAYDKDFNPVPINIEGVGTKVNPFAWCMVASKDSNSIWISSQPGIYLINQQNHSIKFYDPPLLNKRTVRQIAEDKNGNLWLGMQSTGVFKWTAEKGKTKFEEGLAKFTAIPEGIVGRIIVDSKGYVWIASAMNGVYVIDPDTDKIVMHFTDKSEVQKKLPEAAVSGILEYDDSTMIMTTSTYVVRYNRIQDKISLTGGPEYISGYIASIERDKNGYLWMATTNGLYRINIEKKIFVSFNRGDGIENEHFIPAASRVLPDGRMLFGTTNHFIVFDPAAIKINAVFPDVRFTDFKVMNKSLRVDSLLQLKEIELEYDQNSLVIEFSTLLYYDASLVKYKLDDLDKDWVIANKNKQAIYNYLPPGLYTFYIKTINAEGKESTKTRVLLIRVNPPFWKTWWFYSIIGLLVSVFLFWLDRQRMKRKESIQKMRSDIADKLHQDVTTGLNNINILSEMAKLKADKDIEKSKEFIQQIHSKSQQMMIGMEDVMWGINPENDSMQKTIERIKEHIDGLRNRYGVQIDLLVDEKVERLNLNMQLRQNVFGLLRSGSTNIIRTGAASCRILIGFRKPNLIYTLEFDSSHTDMVLLNNLLQRQELAIKLEEINAVLDIQLHKTMSVIELTIPVY